MDAVAIGESIVKHGNRTSLSLTIHFILSPIHMFISDSQSTSSLHCIYPLPSITLLGLSLAILAGTYALRILLGS